MTYDYKFDAVNLKDNLNCARIGSIVMFLPEIDSTNNLVKKYFLNGAEEGLVVIAESQTNGRGRRGRNWYSIPETGVYLSVLLKPHLKPDQLPLFTLLAGVASVAAINKLSHQRASLKWPNDVIISGKKVCGLLCELIQSREKPDGLIIGIGLNANHLLEQFPDNLKNTATSLRLVNGSPIDRLTIIRSLLINLDREYQIYLNEGIQPVIEKWRLNTDLFGKKVSVTCGSTIITGTAMHLNESGRLILLRDDGHEEAFDSGEVTLQIS